MQPTFQSKKMQITESEGVRKMIHNMLGDLCWLKQPKKSRRHSAEPVYVGDRRLVFLASVFTSISAQFLSSIEISHSYKLQSPKLWPLKLFYIKKQHAFFEVVVIRFFFLIFFNLLLEKLNLNMSEWNVWRWKLNNNVLGLSQSVTKHSLKKERHGIFPRWTL